jgi:hypothetical protein
LSGWNLLEAELAAWRQAGRKPALWWRDDDATEDKPSLRQLLALRREAGLPLALAVIPAAIEASLAPLLKGEESLSLLQHGYAHRNHALPGAKKRELGDERPLQEVTAEIAEGLALGRAALGKAWLPVLVPPWNRIAPDVAAALPGLGFRGLSTHGRRPRPPEGLTQVNSHLDILSWKPRAAFRGEGEVLTDMTAMLKARRLEDEPGKEEPLGLLTHHKQHDEAAWNFLFCLLSLASLQESVSWRGAVSLFFAGEQGERTTK